jgi:uncharacterized protein (TIGR02246 family)
MNRYAGTCGLVLGLMAAGCAGTTGSASPAVDIEAVRAVETAWVRDIATKDVEKFASYYADDATVLMPNTPLIAGKDKVKAALKPMLADPNFALTFQPTRIEPSRGGDLVYAIGTYAMTVSDAIDKTPVTDKGKYVTIYRKQADGSWKAVVDMINSDLPPASATYR